MPRFEYYNTGDDNSSSFYDVAWQSQTFTTTSAHKITSVKLKLYRVGTPGTITVSIKAVDVNFKPTGDDLCSGTTNGDTLTTDSGGEWIEITLGDGYILTTGTQYAIVVRALSGDVYNKVVWRMDAESPTPPTYEGGGGLQSTNSGSTWGIAPIDMMFETWGFLLPSSQVVIVG
jgi:hypothetical protein